MNMLLICLLSLVDFSYSFQNDDKLLLNNTLVHYIPWRLNLQMAASLYSNMLFILVLDISLSNYFLQQNDSLIVASVLVYYFIEVAAGLLADSKKTIEVS